MLYLFYEGYYLDNLGKYKFIGILELNKFSLIFSFLSVGLLINAINYIDVSDGLAADLDHICRASQVAMEVETLAVPLSAAGATYAQDPNKLGTLLTGGDDYQLAFTVNAENEHKLKDIARATNVALTRIGVVSQSPGQSFSARFMDAGGAEIGLEKRGYTHF